MSRPVKYVSIFILVICGVLIAGTVLLHVVDLDPYRERIERMATEATGRQVHIGGHIDINLFPHPEVILNDVSLANAKWGTEPTMVSVGHVDAAISFLSLFSDMIIVRRVRLSDVSVLLEQNDQHLGNWVMGPAGPSADREEEKKGPDSDGIKDLPVIVDLAEFREIVITVRGPGRPDQVYHLSSFSLEPEASGKMLLKSSGDLLGYPMKLNGEITSRGSIASHNAVTLDLRASSGDVELTGRLSTGRLAIPANLQGTISLKVKDIAKALENAKIEAPLKGPLTADATVNIDGSVYKAALETRVEGITTTVDALYAAL